MFYHDAYDPVYRSPLGAVKCGQDVTICAKSDCAVTLRLWGDRGEEKIPMTEKNGLYSASFTAQEAGLLWYCFLLEDGRVFCAPDDLLGGESVLLNHDAPLHSHQITVYSSDYVTPSWMREAVVYQIFPDRFCDGCNGALLKRRKDICIHTDMQEMPYCIPDGDGEVIKTDDFYGGNLKGIEQKLPYLRQLGVTALYLNPIFESPSNHKYNTGNYMRIDPTFGDEADFVSLCKAAHALQMRVILDGVFSHTGDDSVYFNRYGRYPTVGAYQSKKSRYFKWYTFRKFPDDYKCWWDFKTLPNVNEMEPSYLDFIIRAENSVIAKWLQLGADGWRLDVADELPEEFIQLLRARVKQIKPDACIIGEVWEDASNKISYGKLRHYLCGQELDSVMNYPLREALIQFFLGLENAADTARRITCLQNNYPKEAFYSMMNLIGSHDRSRIINILGECDDQRIDRFAQRDVRMTEEQYALGKARLKKMFTAVSVLPGMPTIYYGDEAGLQGMRDPFCRAFYPWGRQDTELVEHFQQALQMRADNPVLRTGFLRMGAVGEDTLVVERYLQDGLDAFGQRVTRGQRKMQIEIMRR